MDDRAVIEAFLEGARQGSGLDLHIEDDTLFFQGWWQAAFRLAPDAFMLRDEAAPDDAPIIEEIAESLRGRGLQEVPGDFPLLTAIAYAEITLIGAQWQIWSVNPALGEAAILTRAGMESVPRDWTDEDGAPVAGLSAQLEGARRIAGLPPTVVVAVGLVADDVHSLEAMIPECRFETRDLGEIAPEACGDLGPHAIVVDARTRAGREFIMELRAAACGRFLPVAAVTDETSPPLGADVALRPEGPLSAWRDALVAMLPESYRDS